MSLKRFAILVVLLAGVLVLAGREPLNLSVRAQQPPASLTSAPYPPPQTPSPPQPTPTVTLIPPTSTPTPAPETRLVLEYIAQREGILAEQLRPLYEMRREYPLQGRAFWAVKAERVGGDLYMALMDLADGSFYDDEEALIDAEAEIYLERHGKLDPELNERLQLLEPNDRVYVAIWMMGSVDLHELWAEVAARRPDVIRYSIKPGDVADSAVAAHELAEYDALLTARMTARTEALVALLRTRGFAVTAHGEIPAVTAWLPKQVVLELTERPDVAIIYLAEAEAEPELDSAIPTGRAPMVWKRDITGSGIDVAILDTTNVQPDHNYLTVVTSRPARDGVGQHATGVACEAACRHETYRGMAPDASVISAGFDGREDDLVEALRWAADQGAEVMTTVVGFHDDDLMHFTDRAFDHWARARNRTVVKSAGNKGSGSGNITSPGKAWNLVTVGGIDDKNNSNWSDDQISSVASWRNPSNNNGNRSGESDREKPEVVAVADSVTDICETGPGYYILCTGDGTSASAPQVAGLAALVMDRHGSLPIWPEAVKAIIMASAVHNIQLPTVMRKDGVDDKDGAGAIDATLADTAAQVRKLDTSTCDASCWWGLSITNSNLPVGSYLERQFYARRGERVRIAISWWARADCSDSANCLFDRLDTDLDLYVRAPDGTTTVDSSTSFDNNYEIVDFTASQTGHYTIRVNKYAAYHNETSNALGIALVKEATYLPDVKANFNGWTSEITIRNDGATTQDIKVTFLQPDGSYINTVICDNWQAKAVCRFPATTAGNFWGHAVVNASESVSVIVTNKNGDEITAYNGILPEGSSGDPGWEQAGTVLYAPMVKENHPRPSGRSSDIYVVNVGSADTHVDVTYYDGGGSIVGTDSTSDGGGPPLQPGQANLLAPFSPDGDPSLQSAVITSRAGQPLAALVMEYDANDPGKSKRSTHNVFRAGQAEIFAPLVKKDWGARSKEPGCPFRMWGALPRISRLSTTTPMVT